MYPDAWFFNLGSESRAFLGGSGTSWATADLPSSRPLPRPSHRRCFWPGAAAVVLRAVMWRGSARQQPRPAHRPPGRALPVHRLEEHQRSPRLSPTAHCMRSHGVPTFPDPTSSGQIPKTQVVSASKSNPSRFDSADSACRHLLPNGGNGETPAQIAQDWSEFRDFARCMRSHGVSNWPDPTSRSTTDRRPAFDITAVGLDGHSPQLRATAQQCALWST